MAFLNKINFKKILDDIKPTEAEDKQVKSLSDKLIKIINEIARNNEINAKAVLVGSVAKGTWLFKGVGEDKADIDIFIKFPIDTSADYLKEKGLYLGWECIKMMKGKWELRYASHPYVTGIIDGFEIDFVPCYHLENSDQLKSAVDRTIPHTKYVQANLKNYQADEVILLKRFMECVGTYGSEFKVGGFAGYLCELLVLYYDTFIKVLKAASSEWKPGYKIDLENYKTGYHFNEPLVVVDPVDKKRNVAAALSLQKMSEFVVASRNFLNEPSATYFYPKKIQADLAHIIEHFSKRGTKSLILSFKTPDIPADALYPQIKKTENSMVQMANREGFTVFGSSSWTDEKEKVIILLEFDTWKLPKIKTHSGPLIWSKNHQERFLEKYKGKAWLKGDRWMVEVERKYREVEYLLKKALSEDKIGYLRFGKHIKNEILKNHELMDLMGFLKLNTYEEDFLIFLTQYLHKNEILWR